MGCSRYDDGVGAGRGGVVGRIYRRRRTSSAAGACTTRYPKWNQQQQNQQNCATEPAPGSERQQDQSAHEGDAMHDVLRTGARGLC
jgi:hypothetical protein